LRQLTKRFFSQARGELDFWTLHAVATNARKTFHITLRYPLPYHLPREQVSAFAHGVTNGRSIQKFDRLTRDCIGILERNERASAIIQQLERVPVGRGNDHFSCT